MQESKEIKEQQEEKLIDIKGTFKQFIVADEPELNQEEAIMRYGVPKKKKNNTGTDDDSSEEQDHLKRVKQELLASLKRVEKLEETLFKNREEILKLNVKNGKNGGFTSNKSLGENEKIQNMIRNQKERE